MKILALSDSHGNIERMVYAVDKEQPDVILHLGDCINDAYKLWGKFPAVSFHMVAGNCDGRTDDDTELTLEKDGVRIYMTHGHLYGVKNGLSDFIEGARHKKADLGLFGHTHKTLIRKTIGIWIMNPGQMEQHDNRRAASYGIVNIVNGAFDCSIMYLPI